MLRLYCLLGMVLAVQSASAPFITPCKNADNACAAASAQSAIPVMALGVPSLGISSLDPMHIDLIESNQGGLQLTFRNTEVTGMKDCKVLSVKHDVTKGKQIVSMKCSVDLVGDYKLGGRLIVLPIQGEGKYNINIRDIVIKTSVKLSTVPGADGKDHWHVADWKHAFQVKTGVHFHFDNLFNGNQVLGEPVLKFANDNWEEVMNEIAPPVVREIVAKVLEAIDALYKAVPAEELAIE